MAEFVPPTGQRVPRQSPRRKNAAGNGARDHICRERSETLVNDTMPPTECAQLAIKARNSFACDLSLAPTF